MLVPMPHQLLIRPILDSSAAPFLPLVFRFVMSFGLVVLHLGLTQDADQPRINEMYYLLTLGLMFLEALWEAARSLARTGQAFATPSVAWVRFNLVMDLLLVTLTIAFQGVDQERFLPLYLFPVLASAFYFRIPEIVGMALLSAFLYVATLLLFSAGLLPSFGATLSGDPLRTEAYPFLMALATLQILAATFVVVVIRKHFENLRSSLDRSTAVVDDLSALYRRVVDSMFTGLLTTNMEGMLTSANPAAESILQRPLPPGMRLQETGLEALPLEGSRTWEQRVEGVFRSPTGQERIFGGNVAPIRDGEGNQTGYLVVFQDLTEIKALEERARLSERMAALGELSSELAHELRNPVASIQGCAQILGQGNQPKAMMDRVLTILKRESERVGVLVSSFLDFTRPRPVRLQPLELRGLMDEIRAAWETDQRNLGIRMNLDEIPPLRVVGDPLTVHQVFTNLLSNARKALQGRPDPAVGIRFHVREREVEVRVEDNGCGMPPERLKSIFVPFASGFAEGSGLGMSLVFQFVQQMGWDIRVESEEEVGTLVLLRIPKAS